MAEKFSNHRMVLKMKLHCKKFFLQESASIALHVYLIKMALYNKGE